MRVPLTWLREYCDPPLDVAAIEERLTMTGTKVEAIHHHGVRALEAFVVGRVLSCEQHPDADRLRVCQVDLGPDAGEATIVCGAPNVAAGQTVAVARPGAVMPDGTRLKAANLRGVRSEGMILAEDELDIGSDHAGIMVLDVLTPDADLTPGTPLERVLPLATEVIELEVTPNRPDCLGVYGVARELHAATGAPLAPTPWAGDPGSTGSIPDPLQITVECPELCPRFTVRVFDNVKIGPSPPWLKARLMAAGQRPISNVVDITNYVMLLTSQPLHAFDLDRVAGGRLNVRLAGEGEEAETLDGQRRVLDAQMILIEDAEGPTSIAGVMGGARSEVGPQTVRVAMEAACWDGPNIHRTSTRLGLRSEASARFEKGLPPQATDEAQAVASALMIELTGATLLPGTVDVGERGAGEIRAPVARLLDGDQIPVVHLRERRVSEILGTEISGARQAEILRSLGFEVGPVKDGLSVAIPSFRRRDVTREIDLIEEVARIDGLDRLPAPLPRRRPAGRLTTAQRQRRRALDALVGRGLREVVGWSFLAPQALDRLLLPSGDPHREAVRIENPLSEELSLMRPLLLPSLLEAARHNAARGAGDLRLFEAGTVYRDTGPDGAGRAGGAPSHISDRKNDQALPHEHLALGILLAGRARPVTWRESEPPVSDFFAARGVLDALTAALHLPVREPVAGGTGSGTQPFLHPGRSATLSDPSGGEPLGWIGELHPTVAAAWDLPAAAVLELDLDRLIAAAPAVTLYRDLTSFPALNRDLAIVVGEEVPAGRVLEVVRGAAGSTLDDVRVFDVYRGPQVGEGRCSLALALRFRAPDRTLADEDVAAQLEKVVAALGRELGGERRA